MRSILVWDIPTRLFHWLFAISFAVAFATAEIGDLAVVHVFTGLLALGLVVYRVIWGLVGSRYARFSSFLFSPSAALKHLLETVRGKAERHVGHNPAGSWAIYFLLTLGLAIGFSGLTMLFAGEQVEEVHEVLAIVTLNIALLHIIGVVVASLKHRENLPRSMVTGRKESDEAQGISSARPGAAAVMIVLMASFSISYWSGWDAQTESVRLPFLSQPLKLAEQDKDNDKEGHHSGKHEKDD
jgi:cytochrome b